MPGVLPWLRKLNSAATMPGMQTISTSRHVLRLARDLLQERGLPQLTDDQAQVLVEAMDRWYGVPVGLPTAGDMATHSQLRDRE